MDGELLAPVRPLRVLVMDDEPRILDIYRLVLVGRAAVEMRELPGNARTFLSPRGTAPSGALHLALCDNGTDALEAVRKSVADGDPFAVIFMDVMLGAGPSGITIGERIRELDSEAQIVIVSGQDDLSTAEISRRLPPFESLFYLHKPFYEGEIRQFAAALGEKWRNARRVRQLTTALEREAERLSAAYQEVAAANSGLKLAQAKLVESGKMAALGQLAAMVAHEIRNPLSAVVSCADFLAEDLEKSKLSDHPTSLCGLNYVETIQKAAARCAAVVDSLLAFSRRPGELHERVDLADVVRKTTDFAGAWLKEQDTAVEVRLPADLVVAGSANQLQQVLTNLLMNAAQSLQRGGKITILGGTQAQDVWLSVSDDGPGIPESNLAHVFEPFFTTKAQGLGTGLGLIVCRQIVAAHNGNLVVRSDPGRETTFTIRLPAFSTAVDRTPVAQGGERWER